MLDYNTILIVLILLLIVMSSIALYLDVSSKDWATVKGKILLSKTLGPFRGGRYRPYMEYEYIVNGRKYKSNRRVFMSTIFTTKRAVVEEIVKKYKQNSEVVVYYNELYPAMSVVTPRASIRQLLVLIGMLASLEGFLLLIRS